ncbi:uncharacterized protein LOC128340955 isoform X2 [Hemicordylus capensis]|uniref:uncharacterized protein LOC128340955 isoform X2 n=1 Tax=Hemicordylus capensis TaxID=884348 RepID=UPI0023049327|nr:uncharacterized protein LOC128340955 isoform X2 [Hemicordylus capensis]
MAPLLLALLLAAASLGCCCCAAAPSGSRFSEARVARWAAAALRQVAVAPCPERGGLLPWPQCQRLARLSQGPGPAVYVSEPARPGHKVRALLPDGWGDRPSAPLVPSRNQSGGGGGGGPQRPAVAPSAHDAVLVLDPSPGANFGHPLLLFYVDFNVSPRRCRSRDRLYLGSYECLTPAQRSRCENQLKRRPGRGKGRSQRSAGRIRREEPPVGLCEIHFLPMVVVAQDPKHLQKLHCMDLRGFSPCPQPLPLASSSSTAAYCELNKNTRRCHRQQLPMYKSCRLYQTCDHAVLIAGGWQEQVTYPHHVHNLVLFYQMLRRNGFRQEHIKAFFASEGQASVAMEMGDVHPATEKLAIRSHLALVCRSLHCADSLVLYLNSPAASDGTMLLWDANHNGIVGPWSAVLASGTPAQLLNVTLAGAPCHSVPPLGEEERQRRYQGCQNLPTMLWYQSRHQQLPQEDD